MTTVHSYTGDQPVHDTAHKIFTARAPLPLSMIPTTTGAASALGLVLPDAGGPHSGHCHPRAARPMSPASIWWSM